MFSIGGFDVTATRKYKNVVSGHPKVAFVIDDLASVDPWRPRAIRVYGTADAVARTGQLGEGTYLRITPTVTWSMAVHEPFGGKGTGSMKRTVWS